MTVTTENVLNKLDPTLFTTETTPLFDCETAMDEQTITNITSELDTTDYVVGSGSCKLTVASGFTTGNIASKLLTTTTDLTKSTHLKLKFKSSIALSAGDVEVHLSDNPEILIPLEELDIPAITATNTWHQLKLELTDPSQLKEITSVGLKATVDKGACTLRVDDVKGYNEGHAVTEAEVENCITSATNESTAYLGLTSTTELPATGMVEDAVACWAAGLLWNMKINTEAPQYQENKKGETEGDKLIQRGKNLLNAVKGESGGDGDGDGKPTVRTTSAVVYDPDFD